jgi:hypothetical protein
MDSGELEQRRYNPTLPSGPKKKKKPKKKAPKKPAPKKPAPKATPKNSTGGDQPVRVGRAAKQQPKKKLQYIISEARGLYAPKPKAKKDTRSFGQRVADSQKPKKGKVYPRGFGQR